MANDIEKRVEAVIEKIRPSIQMDGGDIELVAVEENVATVRMSGACSGCAMANITLKQGVETAVQAECPEITSVEAIFA